MDGQTDAHTEFLPFLQDFVPYWGRYSATLKEAGMGTTDLMMPFSNWFENVFCIIAIIFSQHVKLTQN